MRENKSPGVCNRASELCLKLKPTVLERTLKLSGDKPLVDFGGNKSTMSKSGTQTRGLSPLFIGRQTHAQVY